VLDFISHPMLGRLPDLPLFFDGSPKVGLGLFSSIGIGLAVELGLFIMGVVVYMGTTKKYRLLKSLKQQSE